MKTMRWWSLCCALCCAAFNVYAGQTLVLIHGYLADGSEWRSSGVVTALQRAGWQDMGHLVPQGYLAAPQSATQSSARILYSVTLTSEAPLQVQAQQLANYLQLLQQRHPQNSLILVGHSAGGVVARLVVLNPQPQKVQGLISIASPHLGTDKAELGVMATQSPLSWFAPFFGMEALNRSSQLYLDLVRETPSSLLFWLNRQPHPNIFYASIVRVNEQNEANSIVPAYSQDMNNVPALRGKSVSVPSVGLHSLQFSDGILLAKLLQQSLPDN